MPVLSVSGDYVGAGRMTPREYEDFHRWSLSEELSNPALAAGLAHARLRFAQFPAPLVLLTHEMPPPCKEGRLFNFLWQPRPSFGMLDPNANSFPPGGG